MESSRVNVVRFARAPKGAIVSRVSFIRFFSFPENAIDHVEIAATELTRPTTTTRRFVRERKFEHKTLRIYLLEAPVTSH